MQSNTEQNLNDISGMIIGASIEVHKQLGAGLLESVYEACLVEELKTVDLMWSSKNNCRFIIKVSGSKKTFVWIY